MARHVLLLLIAVVSIALCVGLAVGFVASDKPQELSVQAGKSRKKEVREVDESIHPPVTIRDSEVRKLRSKFVDQEYSIYVYLPRHYRESDFRCPVVYVLDAEYNFGCVSYIARRLIKNGDIPEVIVVGIAYDTDYDDFYARRSRDLTPTVGEPSGEYGSGGAEAFTSFLQNELIPFVDEEYRTVAGDRTIVGHSYGGLFGLYMLFKHTHLFSRYLVVSPSIWYDDGVVKSYEREYATVTEDMHARVYLSAGDNERSITGDVREMTQALENRAYPGLRFEGVIEEGEHHRSIFAIAYTRGLRFLFQAGK